MRPQLSRDSRVGQRIRHAFAIEIGDGIVDGVVECRGVGEGSMCQVTSLEIVPDDIDAVEFGCVFGQPLDGEPVCASGNGGERALAGVDRAIVLDQHDRPGWASGLRPLEMLELFEMSDEVAAVLGRAGMHDELPCDAIGRAQHCDFLGLPRCRHAQIRARLRPYPG